MPAASVFDDRICTLGEGVLWHPERQQLFWFDIIGKRLLSQSVHGEPLSWQFDELVSAAGWVDQHHLLIASETGLGLFNLESGRHKKLCDLEADNPVTRSNDGRADPWGGFWIGTMGKRAEADAGAIYRYYRGELRQLIAPVTIPNAICFSPDRRYAYFADTARDMIWRQPLHPGNGWTEDQPEPFIDCGKEGVSPDGAVVDAQGNLWNAQWGAARVACYCDNGQLLHTIAVPTQQVTCLAFGGASLQTLFISTATQELTAAQCQQQPDAGKLFSYHTYLRGNPETAVKISGSNHGLHIHKSGTVLSDDKP